MDALLAWLACYCDAPPTAASLEDGAQLRALARQVFGEDVVADAASLEAIGAALPRADLLQKCAGEGDSMVRRVAVALLVSIVESDSPHREECVEHIMTLDETHQALLMEVIQESMGGCDGDVDDRAAASPGTGGDCLAGSPASSSRSSIASTPSHLRRQVLEELSSSAKSRRKSKASSSRPPTKTRRRLSIGASPDHVAVSAKRHADLSSKNSRLTRENKALKEELTWLTSQLEEQKQACERLESEKASVLADHEDGMRRRDRDATEAEDALREEFEATLRDRDAQIAALKEAGAEAARLSGTVQSLRDEIAIARGAVAAKDKLEAKLISYREKIEAAGDLHAQIKTLDAKCRTLMTRAEKAEKQAAKVPVLSSKVDEYKRAVAEAEVKASELAVKNRTQETAMSRLKESLENMREAG